MLTAGGCRVVCLAATVPGVVDAVGGDPAVVVAVAAVGVVSSQCNPCDPVALPPPAEGCEAAARGTTAVSMSDGLLIQSWYARRLSAGFVEAAALTIVWCWGGCGRGRRGWGWGWCGACTGGRQSEACL